MSTVKVTNVQHGSAAQPNIVLNADGSVSIPSLDLAFDSLDDVTIVSPSDGQLLRYDNESGEWLNADVNLDDLANVDAPAPSDGDALVYNDATGEWEAGSVAQTLGDLTDVVISNPQDAQSLSFDSDSGTFVNAVFPGLGLRNADVVVTVGTDGDFPTLNEALEFLSALRTAYSNSPIKGLIRLQPDFVMSEQVLVDGKDFSWVTILSDAGSAPIDISTFDEGAVLSDYEQAQQIQTTVSQFSAGNAANLDSNFIAVDDAAGNVYYFWYQVERFAQVTLDSRVRVTDDEAGTSPKSVAVVAGAPGSALSADFLDNVVTLTLATTDDATQAEGSIFSDDGGVVTISADANGAFDGTAGNVAVEIEDTGSGGLTAVFDSGSNYIEVDFGGETSATTAEVATAIDGIAGFSAVVTTGGTFTAADDLGIVAGPSGGVDAGTLIAAENSAALVATAVDGAVTPTVLNVTNAGSAAYLINNVENPTLRFLEGETYTINVNAVGHPFWLQTVPAPYSANDVLGTGDGVTANGTQDGTITYVVPSGAPAELYYVCQNHQAMAGNIEVTETSTIVSAEAIAAGAISTTGTFALTGGEGQSSDPTPAGETSVEIVINTGFDATQAAASLRTLAGVQATLSSGGSGRTVTISNDADGDADDPLRVGGFLAVSTTIQGRDDGYTTLVNAPGHTFSDGDLITIRNHVGLTEEVDYNGRWTVANAQTDTFELDFAADPRSLYSPARVGQPNTAEAVLPENVQVVRAALTVNFEFFYFPAFGVARGVLPTIGCVFEMDQSGTNTYLSYKDGLNATDQGRINLLPFSGFVNAGGSNIYATRSSIINANDAIADGAGRHGFWAYSSSIINARRASATNCGAASGGEDVGGGFDAAGTPIGSGVVAERGSLINAEGVDATGSVSSAFIALYGGQVNVGADPGLAQGFGTSSAGEEYQVLGGVIFGVNGDSQGWITPPIIAPEKVVTANTTLALADRGHVVAFDSASNLTLTVPLNSAVAFPLGTLVNVYRAGTGDVDIVGAQGVTVRNVGSISEQFGEVSLRKRDVNEWVLVGQVDEP